MAKFSLYFDTRGKTDKSVGNISVRMFHAGDTMYLKICKLTKQQYETVFVKKSMDPKSVKFRENCNTFLSRCETTFSGMKGFHKTRFRQLSILPKIEPTSISDKLLLSELFDRFLEKNNHLKLKTKDLYSCTLNSFDKLKENLSIWDITPDLLRKYEKDMRDSEKSDATIAVYFRHLRSVINYSINVDKTIPKDYEYPFGKGGIQIKKHENMKLVMSNKEIVSIINLEKFLSSKEEYARNIWLLLYYCNGMNYADLFKLKWENRKGNYFIFNRMKTENTNRVKRNIIVPITPKVEGLLNKVGKKKNSYVLGFDIKGYDEKRFNYKKDWELQKLNLHLKNISERLKLSVDLRIKTSRDSYATTLKRAGRSIDEIGEMMGHSNRAATEHYLASLDIEKTDMINECLL
jgi:integrase